MTKDKDLLQSLISVLDGAVQKQGKQISHLRFARPTKQGWSFFKKKTPSWTTLEDILTVTQQKHPHCTRAHMADVLSELINISKKDFTAIRLLL